MRINLIICIFISMSLLYINQGCHTKEYYQSKTKTIVIYDDYTIPGNAGVSPGVYTEVDGFHYVNILVEFEQHTEKEAPISLGVKFAHSISGKWMAESYFNCAKKNEKDGDAGVNSPIYNSWHGPMLNKSSYIARYPIMGPFIQISPFNKYERERKFSLIMYLTA